MNSIDKKLMNSNKKRKTYAYIIYNKKKTSFTISKTNSKINSQKRN